MTGVELMGALSNARLQTIAQGPVWIDFAVETRVPVIPPARRHAAWPRRLAFAALRRLVEVFLRFGTGSQQGRGVLDPGRRRCMVDYGSYATCVSGDRMWGGLSGTNLDRLQPRELVFREPLWMLDATAGAVEILEFEQDETGGGLRVRIRRPRSRRE